ncbi:B3 domain-containing protein REM20-like [Salvia divinorum]|uniref:B3 domain-containing protein REM20-like n=1 Tax=Salvia divinorum TaxID=28513 RepID=A0ABD1HNV6_SALDI
MKRTKSLATKEELSFFKVISADKRMRIPRGNIPQMQGILGRKVTLRDVDKNLWTLEVEREGDDFYFDKGWPQFHQENHLEPGDVVTFDYKHDGLFDFILLGSDACGKKGAGCPRFSVEEEVHEFTDEQEEVEDDDGEDDDYVVEQEEIEDDDDDEDYVVEQWKKSKSKMKEREIKDESDEDDEIEILMKESKSRSSPSPSSLRQKKHDKEDYYRDDIFRSGLAVRPKNPYFVSTSRKLRKNVLYLPNEVIERWKLKFESKMLVVDASGRKWHSRIKKWKDGRLWCTGGWKKMCTANNISAHDTCICEFVQRGSDVLYMLVHAVDAPK